MFSEVKLKPTKSLQDLEDVVTALEVRSGVFIEILGYLS